MAAMMIGFPEAHVLSVDEDEDGIVGRGRDTRRRRTVPDLWRTGHVRQDASRRPWRSCRCSGDHCICRGNYAGGGVGTQAARLVRGSRRSPTR